MRLERDELQNETFQNGTFQNGTFSEWNQPPLGLAILSTDDVVPLDYRGNPHASAAVFHAAFHAHDLTQRAYKDFGPMGDFRRKSQGNVEFGAGLEILVENEVKATRGNVPGLALLAVWQTFRRNPND